MIPLKLEISNFLSYRETAVIDFDGLHLACISGANGAGKSTIFDAMTWALFGKSRSKSDDDLVNRIAAQNGETAEIRFTFELEDVVYRVIRRNRVGKTGSLELQIYDGDGRWRSLTEGKLRETQNTIEKLLGMNYDVFTNASFFVQGQADAFTAKKPNERKKILSQLLEVDKWDEYKTAVTEKRKEVEGQIAIIDARLAEMEAELDEAEEREAALAAAKAKQAEIADRLQDKEALLLQARKVHTAVSQQQKAIHDLATRLEQAHSRVAQLQKTRQSRQTQRQEYQVILDEAEAIEAAFTQWQALDVALQEWQQKADEFNRLQQEKRPFELTLAGAKSTLEQRQKQLQNQAARVDAARNSQVTLTAEKQKSEEALARVQERLAILTDQETAWQEAQVTVSTLAGEQKARQRELSQLQAQEKRMAQLAVEKEEVLQNLAEAEASLTAVSVELEAATARSQRHAAALAEKNTLEEEQKSLRQEMERYKARIEQLKADAHGACPLCGQPLTDAHRDDVVAELETEGKGRGDRFRRNKDRLAELAAEIETLSHSLKQQRQLEQNRQTQQDRVSRAQARLQEIEQALAVWQKEGLARLQTLQADTAVAEQLAAAEKKVAELETAVSQKKALEKERQTLERQLASQEARLAEAARLIAEWEESGQQELAEVTAQLTDELFAPEAQEKLAELETRITAVGYDAQVHQQARLARDACKDAPARYQKLQEVRSAVKPLDDSLADLDTQIAEQETAMASLQKEHEAAQAQLAALTADSPDLTVLEDEVQALREERVQADRQVGAAQQRLDVLEDVRQQQEHLREERAAHTLQVQRLKLLEKACGRQGVQALLIEQALPEIEERANEMLDRLTGGEMRVMFETQRQLKSRDDQSETLDIHIIDSAGERPYDNYSGGEQFRVNFAIRLALSQLLAKRAGAKLQTLVIDEGFGSQDPLGRQRLVEAINTIQDDFARILVITHVAELRDAFPARIEVEKRPSGSVVTVVQ
ncbi:MAG: SMC family ATPase [Candidatus Promineifilaceae bacterium]